MESSTAANEALRALRMRAGISQQELARRAGISAGMLSNYENGRNFPRMNTVFTLLEALDLNLGHLAHVLGHSAEGEGAPEGRGLGLSLLNLPDAAEEAARAFRELGSGLNKLASALERVQGADPPSEA